MLLLVQVVVVIINTRIRRIFSAENSTKLQSVLNVLCNVADLKRRKKAENYKPSDENVDWDHFDRSNIPLDTIRSTGKDTRVLL